MTIGVHNRELRELAGLAVGAFADPGPGGPAVPPGTRDRFLVLVTRALTDRPFRERYASEVVELSRARGIDAAVADVVDRGELPFERVIEAGPGVLTDAELAAVAASPITLKQLSETIDESIEDETLGSYWWEPFCTEYPDEVLPPESNHRVNPDANPVADSGGVSQPTPRRADFRLPSWAALTGLAAAILIGVFIGYVTFRGTTPSGGRTVEVAQTSLKSAEPRGPDAFAFDLELVSPRGGFATVVIPRRGREPKVFPEYLMDDLRVETNAARRLGPYEVDSGEVVLVVVTKTPASETIRKAAMGLGPNASVEDIESKMKDALWAAGHDWAVVGRVTVRQLAK